MVFVRGGMFFLCSGFALTSVFNKVGTIMRYLLDELMAYEEGYSDMLMPTRTAERHESFMAHTDTEGFIAHTNTHANTTHQPIVQHDNTMAAQVAALVHEFADLKAAIGSLKLPSQPGKLLPAQLHYLLSNLQSQSYQSHQYRHSQVHP